jgi:heparan-alpha-glucosaminide N-acetyltransferase
MDAYRGLVMLAMVSGGFGIPHLAESEGFKGNKFWDVLGFQFEHVPWVGCCFWDLIQPSFMFMVGTALAFSGAKRESQGQSFGWMLFHAVWRSLVLVLLGIFLRSNGREQTNFYFIDVVTQIGLGYVALFLLWRAGTAAQWVAAIVILLAYWGWFASYPDSAAAELATKVEIPADWKEHMDGLERKWNLNTHPAAAFETWFQAIFPGHSDFKLSSQGYCTLNFIPSLATMIFGLIAGNWLRGDRSQFMKLFGLVVAGALAMGVGYAMHEGGLCPIIKRIWTPSWTIYAAGITTLLLAAFYFVFDILPLKMLAKPLAVVGANSIAIYVMSYLIAGWIKKTMATHLGENFVGWLGSQSWIPAPTKTLWTEHPPHNVFDLAGPAFNPMLQSITVVLILWAICWWMDSKKLYIKV